ncbi:MAG TPA: ABC transporter substrate-binding protein [Acidimicrobiales bacterium]|nr:ABC transporter substrate-binding protein [Acidimicrobiales bacterium]
MTLNRLVLALLAVSLVAGACGKNSDTPKAAADTTPVTIRLGYLPNLTQASALVGVDKGIFARDLGSDTLKTQTFNAGGDAVTALFSDAIDAAFVGPNPAINAWAKSKGTAIKIVAGATSGGAALVVKPDITSAEQLKGKTIATPQLGNTQDVAARYWLKSKGLATDTSGGGDVKIVPEDNGLTLQNFQTNTIQGAWVPEPWVTRIVQEGGGHVLQNEADLWPGGKFVTTHLIVSQRFLKAHPATVKRLLQGLVEATTYVNAHPAAAQRVANNAIYKLTQKKLADGVVAAAWKNLEFTTDPIAASLKTSAKHAEEVGLLDPVNLNGIYDLTLLKEVPR